MKSRVGQIITVVVVLAAMSLTCEASRPTSTCPANVSVTVTVHDYDTTGAELLVRSDDHNGQNQAQYNVSDPNTTTNISCGQFRFNLYSQNIRTLYIDSTAAINSSQPPGPPPGYDWQNVELASGCYDQNGNQVYLQNILTSSGNCGMILDFNANGTKYKLRMGPGCPSCVGIPAPMTYGLLTVTCNSISNSQCVNWTFAPNMTPSSTNLPTVANLYYYAKGGKLTFIGQYFMTFRIGVTNP
jgi:hypothetical protein